MKEKLMLKDYNSSAMVAVQLNSLVPEAVRVPHR